MGTKVTLAAYRTAGRPVQVSIDPDATEGARVGTDLTLGSAVTLPSGQVLPAGTVLTAQQVLNAFAATYTPGSGAVADWPTITNIPPNVTQVAGLSTAGFVVRRNDGNWLTPTEVIPIRQKSDLPTPVAGVITLSNNVLYWFMSSVDLTGDRIVCGTNNVLMGNSSASTALTSTGLSGALITGTSALKIQDLGLSAPTGSLFDLNNGATGGLIIENVAVSSTPTMGTIQNYGNIVITYSTFAESANLTLTGTIASFVAETTLWDGRAGQTTITVPAAAVITRRFRFLYSVFTINPGEAGINFSASATIPDESYILDNVNFSGGGTYLAGLTYTSNKAQFFACVGITNTSAIAQYYMTGNATATVISVAGTYVKVAGTTTPVSALQQKFNLTTSNRATYTGASSAAFRVNVFASMQSGNNQVLRMLVAVNGTTLTESTVEFTTSGSGDASNIGTQALVTLNPNDYVEIFVTNTTAANNITVRDLNCTVTRLN